MKKITLTAFICLFSIASSFAQQTRNCGTMAHLEDQKAKNPSLEQQMEAIETYTFQKILSNQGAKVVGEIITLPVVVHVIYNNTTENISDAQILSQIDVLNEDFRRTNSDADTKWNVASDTQIEFALATIDPNGNATTGITRKASSETEWGTNDAMKRDSQGGVSPWDTSEYLNMWVCNIGGGILGYAQFPGGSSATDGVVMSPQYFGSSDKGNGFYLSAPFNKGRTATHEVGHYLNLRHIWGDGACGVDDFVNDTPSSDNPNYGCDSGHTSCQTEDMVENFMDYSDDSCMNLFTAGQKDRMRAVLEAGGSRRSLALSDKFGEATDPDPIDNPDDGGGVENELSYCDSNGNSTADEWIDLVSFAGISNTTGSNGGYADFTNLTATVSPGSTNELIISTGFSSTAYTEFWNVWIDFNQDGDFADAENVASGSSSSDANLSVDVTIPNNATLGSTRMRVSMKYNAEQTACESFEYGEVEDYTVNISNTARIIANKLFSNATELGNETPTSLNAFPNPSVDVIQVTLNTKNSTETNYKVTNLAGETVKSGGLDTGTINVSNLAPGLYLLEVNDGDKLLVTKIIKQ